MSHPSRNNYGQCAVCFAEKDEEIVKCVKCNLTVHGQCYGSSFRDSNKPHDGWKCRYCHANGSYKHFKCRICNSSKFGALKACEKGSQYKFAHLVCAKWTSFICIGGEYNQAPIKGIERCDKLKSALNKLHCDICKQNHATMKCRVKGCNKFYHPLCLIETNRKCMIESNGKKIDGMATTIYYTYCPDHVQLHQVWFTLCYILCFPYYT